MRGEAGYGLCLSEIRGLILKKESDLLEADLEGVVPETLAAHMEAIFVDNAVGVVTATARELVLSVVAGVRLEQARHF